VFDPGNIISDNEFYNSTAMTETQIWDFIQYRGAACPNPHCLRAGRVPMAAQPAHALSPARQIVLGGSVDNFPGPLRMAAARFIG